jgi:ribose/xylose/arabinose/galactoside ABC-type transport system permease subunit
MIKTAEAKPRPRWTSRLRNLLSRSGLLVALFVLFILLWQFAPNFLSVRNMGNVLRAVAINGMIACAMTFVIISGDIDVSVGSAVAWCSSLLGVLVVKQHWPLFVAAIVVVVQQMILHSAAGSIRVKWNVPAFVVTLALYMSLKGLAKVITQAYPITPFPAWFSFWGQGYIGKVIPVPAVLMVVTVLVFYFLSTRTVFGRSVYSVGGNEEAARLSGIPVGRTRITIFAITGMMAALGAIITSSRIMAGAYNVGEGLEFEVIAAVVIGGTSLAGGSGSMIGTFLGVLFIGLLSNGMTLMGVDPYWQEVARGLIVLLAVLISVWQNPIKK